MPGIAPIRVPKKTPRTAKDNRYGLKNIPKRESKNKINILWKRCIHDFNKTDINNHKNKNNTNK